MERIYHTFGPVFDASSRVLILGSMPSVKSMEQGFYYAHPQNRFWKTLEAVTGDAAPETVEGRRAYLLFHRIALWDTLESCVRPGSMDASITDAAANDISALLEKTEIAAVFTNGKTSEKYLKRFFPQIDSVCLPSTSPANAAHFDLQQWLTLRAYLNERG